MAVLSARPLHAQIVPFCAHKLTGAEVLESHVTAATCAGP